MRHIWLLLLILANLGLLLLNLLQGSVAIPAWAVASSLLGRETPEMNEAWRYIVLESRLPAALTALLAGGALGACGLILQSYFRNPLAGPSILGITNGANLAVAIVLLWAGGISGFGLVGVAMIGALTVLLVLLDLGRWVQQPITLLIVGILLSYITSSLLTLLNYSATAEGIQALMIWGMGTFNQLPLEQLPLFVVCIGCGLLLAALLIKPLNGWMLGTLYAQNSGINLRMLRWMVLLCTGLLCATTTAWCGPIAFIGLSVPHMARLLLDTDDHRRLLPYSVLLGAVCTGLCLLLSSCLGDGRLLPINALTPLLGAPVIIYVLLSRR